MAELNKKLNLVLNAVKSYADFPKPGIIFRDVFALLKDPEAFKALHEILLEHIQEISPRVEAIAALESRGFLFGPMLALELQIPFVPIRKKGKLPGKLESVTYDLEYGQDTLEIQIDCLNAGTKVLIIDDLLATGGSMAAASALVEKSNMEIVECLVVIELKDLSGRSNISAPVHSIIQY